MTLRPVLRGGEYVRETVGGVIRDRAPVDGFAWDAGESCGFVPAAVLEEAVGDLKLMRQWFKPARKGAKR